MYGGVHKRLVLFDIDGTLLNAKGLGARALLGAMQQVFGRTFSRKGVVFCGATDPSIVRAIMEKNNHPFDETVQEKLPVLWDNFIKRTEMEAKKAVESPDEYTERPEALPGVHQLIELLEKENVVLGLVTGNLEATAKIKLRSANLDSSKFLVGGFGSDSENRNDLPRIARERAMSLFTDCEFPDTHVFVIGDTPKDIECAKKNGFVSIAVATGRYREQDLQSHDPHHLFPDLSDVERVYQILTAKEAS